MTRTQIRLPDDVFERAKRVCEAREISFAELARRGIEYILGVQAPEPDANRDWEPPKPRRLGWKGLTDAEIKAQAPLAAAELTHTRPRRKQLKLFTDEAVEVIRTYRPNPGGEGA